MRPLLTEQSEDSDRDTENTIDLSKRVQKVIKPANGRQRGKNNKECFKIL